MLGSLRAPVAPARFPPPRPASRRSGCPARGRRRSTSRRRSGSSRPDPGTSRSARSCPRPWRRRAPPRAAGPATRRSSGASRPRAPAAGPRPKAGAPSRRRWMRGRGGRRQRRRSRRRRPATRARAPARARSGSRQPPSGCSPAGARHRARAPPPAARTSSPTTAGASLTAVPSSSPRRRATGASEVSGPGPLGRPRCELTITAAPRVAKVPDRVERPADAGVVGHLAVLEWHVQVGAHEHALAGLHVQVGQPPLAESVAVVQSAPCLPCGSTAHNTLWTRSTTRLE